MKDSALTLCESCYEGQWIGSEMELLCEEHMEICLNGRLYCSVVYTPSHTEELVMGRLLADGLISSLHALRSLRLDADGHTAFVECEINETPPSYTPHSFPLTEDQFRKLYQSLQESPLYQETHSAHTAILMRNHEILCLRDDLGRHNAVDKVLGYALEEQIPLSECILFSSGRLPLDMVEKALNADVGVLASKSLPTVEAVEKARSVGLPILHYSSRNGFLRFS